jgi:23S rRNA (guanine2445-N2)-methyltransferase / 23S rRNA (guanine2069-N7)-methyltransferase
MEELRALGADSVRETRAGVEFTGALATAYRACLWSRLASRILLILADFPTRTADELYAGVQTIDWDQHISPQGTLAVDCNLSASALTHSHYAALKVKDAIVDQFRDRHSVRPSVDTEQPDLRVNVHIQRDQAVISLDLSGDSLHRRGYRTEAGEAPLKENLAAAILLRSNWPEIARGGGTLVDLMCGSGTLLIEAALLAADSAPGLQRDYFGFLRWLGHDAQSWAELLTEARQRRMTGLKQLPAIRGYDNDKHAVRIAHDNVQRAGLGKYITITQRALADCAAEPTAIGLVLANPPYGERLGADSDLPALYAQLGQCLLQCFAGWRAAIFTGNPELGKSMGLRAQRYHTLWNGALECRLLHFEVSDEWRMREYVPKPVERSAGMQMFENRVQKNLKHYGRWARRNNIACYRLYDADLPEYNLAVDIYEGFIQNSHAKPRSGEEGPQRFVHVQEYQAPESIDTRKAETRWREALDAIPRVLQIPQEQMFCKQRRRQKGGTQYEKQADIGVFHEISEGPCRLLVNFSDYLDTGLFLDHRLTRAMLGELAKDKHFLNLFGYTGAATVHAAVGGALSTTTVDMSNTYLDWAERNMYLNKIHGQRHELIQADVLQWLQDYKGRSYDLIFLDPPTFSRSKRMEDNFDIQRDHVDLIHSTAKLLEKDGVLIFSTNLRKFKLDADKLQDFVIEDISRKTLPEDFKGNPKIHQCFKIKKQ